MPPGASMLMRGLGMRGIDKYIKDQKRERKDTGNYNRPKVFSHDGDGDIYPVPHKLHADKRFQIPGYLDLDYNTALVTEKYLEDPRRKSEGLAEDYTWRLFEYDRSQWPRYGFISPYKDVQGRTTRDEHEFKLWHHWHPEPEDIQQMVDEEHVEGDDRPYDRIDNDALLRGMLPGRNGRRHDLEPHRPRRGAVSYNRPRHRQRGFVDYRNPIYRPPYPDYDMNLIQRGTERPAHRPYEGRRGRQPRLHPTPRRSQGPRGTSRLPHAVYGNPGNAVRQERFGLPVGSHYVTRPTRGNPLIYNENGFPHDIEPAFIPRGPRHHRHHPFLEEDEDEDEEDTESHHSPESYIRRPSPQIIYPVVAPYHGHSLGHNRRHTRYVEDTDDEDEDEPFFRRRGHMGRRRGLNDIGREGGRLRVGPRGYDREDFEYGFSGDEDDAYDV